MKYSRAKKLKPGDIVTHRYGYTRRGDRQGVVVKVDLFDQGLEYNLVSRTRYWALVTVNVDGMQLKWSHLQIL